jgi:uncharacterized membrane protein
MDDIYIDENNVDEGLKAFLKSVLSRTLPQMKRNSYEEYVLIKELKECRTERTLIRLVSEFIPVIFLIGPIPVMVVNRYDTLIFGMAAFSQMFLIYVVLILGLKFTDSRRFLNTKIQALKELIRESKPQ